MSTSYIAQDPAQTIEIGCISIYYIIPSFFLTLNFENQIKIYNVQKLIDSFRGTLLLFHPFRNEHDEITSQDLTIKYAEIQSDALMYEQIEHQLAYFAPYQELLDGIEAYIKEQQEDEMEENDHYEEGEENIEVEDHDDLKLETTDVKDIKDFIKSKQNKKEVERETGLMEKGALLHRINMLNLQQRQIFDDIVSRLKSGSFVDNQFLIYIR